MRILLVATLLSWGWPVQAEPDVATVDEARRLFEEGVAAIGRDAYRDALDLFERSAALVPRPVTTFNIGMCQRALANLAGAYESLRSYLAAAEGEPAERRAEAARVVLELDAVLATVSVRVNEPGAEVRVDGRLIGTSPVRESLRLLAGPHVFEAHKPGLAPSREEVELGAGEARDIELDLFEAGEEPSEEEPGIERQWWFWTIIGVAVAGAAVTAGVLLWPEEPTPPDWWAEFR